MNRDFYRHFHTQPSFAVTSPGRCNLIGEHVDYLDGWVLPIAINRHLTIHACPSGSDVCRVWSDGLKIDQAAEFSINDLSPRTDSSEQWLNYIIGVIAGYANRGIEIPGFYATIHSTIPSGAGLSSSAALETGAGLIVEHLAALPADPVKRALLCQTAEHEYAGVPCGIMDQFSIGCARKDFALLIDCQDLSLSHVPLPSEVSVVVTDTKVKHSLADGEYGKRRQQCDEALQVIGSDSFRDVSHEQIEAVKSRLTETQRKRAIHAVSEMKRVHEFVTALEEGDLKSLGQTMRSGHDSLRDNFEVSCQELDFLVDLSYEFGSENGHIGSRMTGGGFGGSTVSLVASNEAAAFQTHLKNHYKNQYNIEIEPFITTAVDGAKQMQIPETITGNYENSNSTNSSKHLAGH